MRYQVWEKLAHKYNQLWVQRYSLGPTRREVLKTLEPILGAQTSVQMPSAPLEMLNKNSENEGASHIFRILDVGCGTGQLIHEIAAKYENIDYLGIDVAVNMIEIAKRSNPSEAVAPKLEFRVTPFDEFESNRLFDIIICTHAFPYFPDKPAMIQKFADLCVEGGHVIIVNSSTNNLKDLIINFFLKATTSEAKYLSIKKMKKLFTTANLSVENIGVIMEKKYMPTIAVFHLTK